MYLAQEPQKRTGGTLTAVVDVRYGPGVIVVFMSFMTPSNEP